MRKHHFIWTQVTDKPLRAGERLICRDFYCPPLLNRDTPLCLHSSLRCNLCHFLHLLRQTLLHSCWLPRVHGFDLWKITSTSTSRHPWAWPPSNVPLPHEFVKCCCCQSPWFCYCSRAPCCYPCRNLITRPKPLTRWPENRSIHCLNGNASELERTA